MLIDQYLLLKVDYLPAWEALQSDDPHSIKEWVKRWGQKVLGNPQYRDALTAILEFKAKVGTVAQDHPKLKRTIDQLNAQWKMSTGHTVEEVTEILRREDPESWLLLVVKLACLGGLGLAGAVVLGQAACGAAALALCKILCQNPGQYNI